MAVKSGFYVCKNCLSVCSYSCEFIDFTAIKLVYLKIHKTLDTIRYTKKRFAWMGTANSDINDTHISIISVRIIMICDAIGIYYTRLKFGLEPE